MILKKEKDDIVRLFGEYKYYDNGFPYVGVEQFLIAFGISLAKFDSLILDEVLEAIKRKTDKIRVSENCQIENIGFTSQYDVEGVCKSVAFISSIITERKMKDNHRIKDLAELIVELIKKEFNNLSIKDRKRIIEWIKEGITTGQSNWWKA